MTIIIEFDHVDYLEGVLEQVASQEPCAISFRKEQVVLPIVIPSIIESMPSILDLNDPTNPIVGTNTN